MQPEAYRLNYQYEETHWWFLARREILVSMISDLQKRRLLAYDSPKLLDYGCGTGGLTQTLGMFGDVLGVDGNEEAISYCRKRGLQNIKQITSTNELQNETFDFVGSFDVLEHVHDDVGLIKEFYRILKPNGLLLLTVPAYQWLWGGEDEVSKHVRRYTKSELRRKMNAAGFETIKASYFNTILFPLIASVRLWNRCFRPKTLSHSDVAETPKPINASLCRIFALESRLLRWVNFPFGVSLIVVGIKRNTVYNEDEHVPTHIGANR